MQVAGIRPCPSDKHNTVARQFGIVFTLPEEIRSIYKSFGHDLAARNGDDSFELPFPATYVIGQDRVIRFAFVNADYTKRAEPADIGGVAGTSWAVDCLPLPLFGREQQRRQFRQMLFQLIWHSANLSGVGTSEPPRRSSATLPAVEKCVAVVDAPFLERLRISPGSIRLRLGRSRSPACDPQIGS